MIINFRQGIISGQVSQNFIQLVDGKVNINVDIQRLDLAFAYGSSDYLFTESENVTGAWGPFTNNVNTYLYWDIDLTSGIRTFGTTRYPLAFGSILPASPNTDQHFFDYTDSKMKVWNGQKWNEKLRVFAGYIQGGAVLVSQSFGSQVNLNAQVSLGYILYDSNRNPLKISDKTGRSVFVTTESQIYTQNDIHNAYKIDAVLMDGKALEPVPAFSCITWKGPKQIGVASYTDYTRPCIGISVEKSGKDDVKQFVTKGFVTNYNNWNFSEAPNTPIFVGATGEITTTVPQKYSLQKIGHIVSPDTVFIDLQEIILIEDVVVIPSPTPTVTPTSSLTPTSTRTPTPTASSSVSPTPTPSVTVSLTGTPSVTITPSPTLTVTPTISLTPTHTASPTATVTPSATMQASPTPTPTIATSSPVEESDTLVLFYGRPTDTDPRLALSVVTNSNSRTDVNDFPLSWPQVQSATLIQSLDGISVGNKVTRKIRAYELGLGGNFVAVNAPDTFTPTFNGFDSSLFKSGVLSGTDFTQYTGVTNQMQPVISTVQSSVEGTLPQTSYAVDVVNNLQYGILRYEFTDKFQELLMFFGGNQLTINVTNPELLNDYNQIGSAGIDTFPNGKAFMLCTLNGFLGTIVLDVANLDEDNLTIDVTYRKLNTSLQPSQGLMTDSGFTINPDIYEIKASDNKYYISGTSRSFYNRQSINDSCNDSNKQQVYSFVIVYNIDTDDTDTIYFGTTYDYGYITTSGNYAFTIDPDLSTAPGPNHGILKVYSLGANSEATLVTSQNITAISNVAGNDLRLRSVVQSDGTINVYTFGAGLYKYDPDANSLTQTNVYDLYEDMDAVITGTESECQSYTNIIIDTWAGKLGQNFHIPPTPTPSVTPTITPTPTATPGPIQANNYDSVILADNPSYYWSFDASTMSDVGDTDLSLVGGSSLTRDSYGSTILNPNDTGNEQNPIGAQFIGDGVPLISNFSMEAWVKPTLFNAFHTVFGDMRDGFYGLQFDGTGVLYLYSESFSTVLAPEGSVPVDTTCHIVVTVDSGNVITTYLNGVATVSTVTYPETNYLTIGFIGTDDNNENFNGNIGNPAIYLNQTLTQSQVTAHYNAGITGFRYPL